MYSFSWESCSLLVLTYCHRAWMMQERVCVWIPSRRASRGSSLNCGGLRKGIKQSHKRHPTRPVPKSYSSTGGPAKSHFIMQLTSLLITTLQSEDFPLRLCNPEFHYLWSQVTRTGSKLEPRDKLAIRTAVLMCQWLATAH